MAYSTHPHIYSITLLNRVHLLISALILSTMLPITSAKAQLVFEEWVKPGGTQDFYVTGKSVSDPLGNTYQAGATLNAQGNYDAIITKYNQKGDEIWIKTFDGSSSGDDVFIDVVYFHSKIMATGVSRNADETASDILTVKLSANDGSTDWENRFSYPGSIFNAGAALTIDESENVYVTGATLSYPALSDAIIIKYGAAGALHWYDRQDISNGGIDVGVKIQYRGGIVTLVGATQTSPSSWRHLALAYNTNGTLLNTYFGTGNGADFEKVVDVVLDNQGNIYITGSIETPSNGYDMYTVKLDDELNLLWDNSYNFSGSGNDRAYSISLDNANNVIITGYSEVSPDNTQFTTVKYNNNGAQLWAKGYDISSGNDTAKVVTTDPSGNIYLSGTFFNGSNQDLKTLKYDPSGNMVWEIDYNGVYNGDDYLLDMTHTGEHIIVMAQVSIDDTYRYVALKYVESYYESPQYLNSTEAFPNAFVRNLGQLCNENGHEVSSVKYLSKHGSYAGFYKNSGFEWMTRTFHNDTTVNDTAQIVSFVFHNPVNGNKVNAFGRSEYFENYYFPYGIEKLERAPFYQKLFYGDIWRGISMETGFKSGQEISFTVSSKGDPKYIGMEISGADSIVKTPAGDILLYTFNGSFLLKRPRAFQKNATGNLTELPWTPDFSVSGGLLTINSIGSYNTQKDLIIRISRDVTDVPETDGFCHSTYFGGSDVEYAYDSEITPDGKPVVCGRLYNPNFYPAEMGLQIISPGGLSVFSAYVVKFDENFVPQFMSVMVADDGMEFYAVAAKSNGDIFAGGMTNGTTFMANEVGAGYQDASFYYLDDYFDGVIALFDGEYGVLKYSTYFGGSEGDRVTDIAVDSQDRLYVVGNINDPEGFPITPLEGAYNHNPVDQIFNDGFLARFSPQLDLDWNTLIGGDNIDNVFAVAIGKNDEVGIAGVTASSNLDIFAIAGTVQVLVKNDLTDYFLMTFNSSGQRLWSTFESNGLNNNPQAANEGINGKHTLAFDNSNALYFGGQLRNLTDVDLVDPGSGAFYLENDNGFSYYSFLVKYAAETYLPVWRTQLMDGLNNDTKSTINSLIIDDNKLYVGGTANDPTLDLLSASSILYSEPRADELPGQTPFSIKNGFVAIFDRTTLHLLHSTYYGGSSDISYGTDLTTLSVNQNNKLFGFGYTSHYYNSDPNYYGIPVKNNIEPNSYYQDNLDELIDAFGFSLCYEGTPLNIKESKSAQNNHAFQLFPNPVSRADLSIINIESEVLIDEISLYDSKGLLIYSNRTESGLYKLNIGSKSLASGVYFVVLSSGNISVSRKLIVLD